MRRWLVSNLSKNLDREEMDYLVAEHLKVLAPAEKEEIIGMLKKVQK